MEKTTITQGELNLFTGDIERFQHWFNRRVIYTPGVLYLAERAHAHWLLDAIVFYFGSNEMMQATQRDRRLRDLQFWHLEVSDDRSAVLSARADSREEPFITQSIPYTDFPLHYVDIWAGFDGEHWTLYLPSEH
jgi:hypothetical protein